MPDNKLDALLAELRAIELWDQLQEDAVLRDEIDYALGFEARWMRRLEIVSEVRALLRNL